MAAATAEVKLRLVIEAVNRAGQSLQQVVNQLTTVGSTSEKVKAAGAGIGAASSGIAAWTARLKELQPQLDKFKRAGESIQQLGTELGIAGGAILGAAAFPVYEAAQFERSMNRVRAVADGTQEEFKQLAAYAQQMGQTSVYSSNQAAEGMRALGQAGFSAQQIMASLVPTLNLAAAGEVSTAEASKNVVNILTQLNLPATDAVRVVDQLAKAAALTTTEVNDLAVAFSYAGPMMRLSNIELELGNSILATFAQLGIDSTRAGTAFRAMVISLAKPTKEASDTFKKLNVEISKNKDGSIDYMKTLADLRDAGASQADWVRIFRREFGGLIGLLATAEPLQKHFREELNKATGEGQRMADVMNEGLLGALTKLKNSVQVLLQTFGDQFLETFTKTIDKVREFVNSVNEASKNSTFVKNMIEWGFAIGGVTVALSALLVPFGFLLKLIGSAITPFIKMGGAVLAAGTAMRALPPWIRGVQTAASAAAVQVSLLNKALLALAAVDMAMTLGRIIEAELRLHKVTKDVNAAIDELKGKSAAAADASKQFAEFKIPENIGAKSKEELDELGKGLKGALTYAVNARNAIKGIGETEVVDGVEGLTDTAVKAQEEFNRLTLRIEELRNGFVRLADEQKRRTEDVSKSPWVNRLSNEVDPEEEKKIREALNRTRQMQAELLRDDLKRINAVTAAEIASFKESDEAKLLDEADVQARISVIAAKGAQQRQDIILQKKRAEGALTLRLAQIQIDQEARLLEADYNRGLVPLEEYLEKKKELTLQRFDEELAEMNSRLKNALDPDEKRAIEIEIVTKTAERGAAAETLNQEAIDARKERLKQERQFQQELASVQMEGLRPEDMQGRFDLEMKMLRLQNAQKLEEYRKLGIDTGALVTAQQAQILEKTRQYQEAILSQTLAGLGAMASQLESVFSDLYEMSGEKAKEFFYLQKAVAVASTIISTIEGAQKAYTAMVGIPYVGPALGTAAAAVAIAAGMARVALIMQQAISAATGGFIDKFSVQAFAKGGKIKDMTSYFASMGRYADGGSIRRLPTTTSDKLHGKRPRGTVPAWLTNKEYVVHPWAVKKFGVGLWHQINQLRFRTDGIAKSALPAVHKPYSGMVVGPEGKDVIPAFVPDQGFVLRKAAVEKYGAAWIEALASGQMLLSSAASHGAERTRESFTQTLEGNGWRRFASGGSVGGTPTSSAPAPRGVEEEKKVTVQNINVLDPNLLGQYLASAPGERQLFNFISTNAGMVKNLLFSD